MMRPLPILDRSGDCQISLGRVQAHLVLQIEVPPDFPRIMPRRWRSLSQRAIRGCRDELADVDRESSATGLKLMWVISAETPSIVDKATRLYNRLAALLFAPISLNKAQNSLQISREALGQLHPAPNLALRGERHGKSYHVPAYSIGDYLDLARPVIRSDIDALT